MDELWSWLHDGIEYETRPAGQPGSILKFQLGYLLVIGWIFPRRGSIFNGIEILVILGAVIAVATILGFSTCDHPNADTNTCIILPTPSTSYLTLMTLCSFVIAFFANTVMTRWWAVRTALQGVMGAAQELIANIVGTIDVEVVMAQPVDKQREIAEGYDKLLKQVNAYCLLILKLLFNGARDQLPARDLIESDMLPPAEIDRVVKLNNGKVNTFHLCIQLANIMNRGANAVLVPGDNAHPEVKRAILTQAMDSIKLLRSNASTVSMYTEVQLPYPFLQIVITVVYAFSIQLIIVCASFISSGSIKKNGDLSTGYLTLIMYVFVLLGLLRLYVVLENPLGDDAADFPGDTYYVQLKTNLMNARIDALRLLQYDVGSATGGGNNNTNKAKETTQSRPVILASTGTRPSSNPRAYNRVSQNEVVTTNAAGESLNPLHDAAPGDNSC
jgi:predicted membrane chloride channel (bestrophin family)